MHRRQNVQQMEKKKERKKQTNKETKKQIDGKKDQIILTRKRTAE